MARNDSCEAIPLVQHGRTADVYPFGDGVGLSPIASITRLANARPPDILDQEAMYLRSFDVPYRGDGIQMRGFCVDGSRGELSPGVLIAHEAPGLDDLVRHRAVTLADRGYVVLALDLYGELADVEAGLARYEDVMTTPGRLHRRATAALNALSSLPNVRADRVGVLGFCLGGIVAMELARARAPIRCAVGIHPGLVRPKDGPDGKIDARVLMILGERDPLSSAEDRQRFVAEMNDKGADWQMHLLGGAGHSFSNPDVAKLDRPGFSYDARADRRAWQLSCSFLHDNLIAD